MGKKSGAPAPDYTAAANAQAAASKENTTQQTWANRPDQYSPFGSETWSASQVVDPATGQPVTKWSQTTSLDPTLQNALDSQMALQQGRSDLAGSMLGRIQGDFANPLDYSGFQQLGGVAQGGNNAAFSYGGQGVQGGLDFGGVQGLSTAADARQRAEQAAYQSQASRLDPRFETQQRKLETDLANRGISRNSQAYTRAMEDFERGKTDAYQQAQLGAIGVGGQEAQRNYGMDLSTRQQQVGELGQQGAFANQAQAQMFGQALQGYGTGLQGQAQNFSQQMQMNNYQNQLRQQQIAEALQQRGMGLNEMNALLSGQQVSNPQFANFSNAGVSETPNLMGAAQNQYNAAQNQQSSRNAFLGNILGGASDLAGMYFSDRRVKRDIRRIGTHARGFGLYEFRYIGERGRRVGVLAQEVRRVMPEAVASNCGVLMVDYSQLGGVAA